MCSHYLQKTLHSRIHPTRGSAPSVSFWDSNPDFSSFRQLLKYSLWVHTPTPWESARQGTSQFHCLMAFTLQIVIDYLLGSWYYRCSHEHSPQDSRRTSPSDQRYLLEALIQLPEGSKTSLSCSSAAFILSFSELIRLVVLGLILEDLTFPICCGNCMYLTCLASGIYFADHTSEIYVQQHQSYSI